MSLLARGGQGGQLALERAVDPLVRVGLRAAAGEIMQGNLSRVCRPPLLDRGTMMRGQIVRNQTQFASAGEFSPAPRSRSGLAWSYAGARRVAARPRHDRGDISPASGRSGRQRPPLGRPVLSPAFIQQAQGWSSGLGLMFDGHLSRILLLCPPEDSTHLSSQVIYSLGLVNVIVVGRMRPAGSSGPCGNLASPRVRPAWGTGRREIGWGGERCRLHHAGAWGTATASVRDRRRDSVVTPAAGNRSRKTCR